MMKKIGLAEAAIIAGTLVRILFWATTPVTGDATFHYNIAKYIADTYTIPSFEYVTGPNPFWWPPLFHILTALVYKITGILTLTPLLFGVAGLIAFSVFARKFYPKQAETATVILAFLPFHVYYSSIGYFETLMFLLAVAAFHFYFSYLKTASRRDFAYAILMSALSASTHYHGFIPLIAIGLHMLVKSDKKAVTFIVLGLLLSSPWYVRNYVVFGNPIWPKVWGGNFPGDTAVTHVTLRENVASLASPGKWGDVFFDFWIGAPNSGEDLKSNIAVGRSRLPLFDLFMMPWAAAIVAASAAAIWGAYRMRKKEILFPALVFITCLGPLVSNGLARMFVALFPFIVVYMADGYMGLKLKYKHILLAVALVSYIGGSYAYSLTYKQMRDPYIPFFKLMEEKIPQGANVVVPFNIQDCIYYSGRRCLRIGSTGGIPTPTQGTLDSILQDYDISYVCCSSLNWNALSASDKMICDRFNDAKLHINYIQGGIWGRCWVVN